MRIDKTTYVKIQNNSFWKSMFKNSFWAFIGDSSASVINLLVIVLLIKLINSSNYGILILAQSYMLVIDVIFNIQCWKSVIIFGQKALVNKDKNSFLYYIREGIKIDVMTAILGGIVSYLLSSVIGNLFGWSGDMILCCQIFSFTIFSHLSGTSTAVLRLFDKFNLVALQKFLTALIKLLAFGFLIISGQKISLIVGTIIYAITDAIGNILLIIFAYIVFVKEYKLKELIESKKTSDTKEFIRLTLWGTLAEIVDIPIQYLDVFIVSILGTELVAVLKVFRQCVGILQKVTSPLQQSSLPQFSELVAEKKYKRSYDVVLKIRNFVLKYGLPLAVLFGLSSIFWLNWIYGKIYSNNWYILLIYMIIQTFALSYTTIHTLFIALNFQKESTIYTFIANACYLLLGYVLVRTIGMVGIVIAAGVQYYISIYLKNKKIKETIEIIDTI